MPEPSSASAATPKDAALKALADYTGVEKAEGPWWNFDMGKALDIMLPAIAEQLVDAIKRDARIDLDWQREHKQNHEDLVRIVATEDAYNAAIRTIDTEVGL